MSNALCEFECFLPIPRAQAFQLVVDQPQTWWFSPFLSEDNEALAITEVGIEPQPGGVCYEMDQNGRRRVWGTVLSIEPPLYIRIAWQVSQLRHPIADPGASSRVMIAFRDAGTATRLEVTHTEFIRHGEGAEKYRSFMAEPLGWPKLLANLSHVAREHQPPPGARWG